METRTESKEKPQCSWCSKSQDDVAALIATPTDKTGPRAYICDECVAVCNSILDDRGIEVIYRRGDSVTYNIGNDNSANSANTANSTNTTNAFQEGAIQ